MNTPGHLSHPKTTTRVLELLQELDWPNACVADVGAGNGYFSHTLGERLRQEQGLSPSEHIQACDVLPAEFLYEHVTCLQVEENGRLPYPDSSFDAVISIEVIEHVEDQFEFVRELARIAKPGGLVIFTTPNVLQMQSRVRAFLCGFPELFDMLPLEEADIRHLGGHIHPISAYYMAFNALSAGLLDPKFHFGRTKRSASFWTILFVPIIVGFGWLRSRKLIRKNPDLVRQNVHLLAPLNSWGMLTARTAILAARKAPNR